MTMAENVIRKACDRCHSQKLSCKRATGDEPCERCTRLGTECKFSPSLRYKKQQRQPQLQQQQKQPKPKQQQQQQQQQQPQPQPQPHPAYGQRQQPQQHQQQQHHYQESSHQDLPGTEKLPSTGSRSPKRRRTNSDPSLVLPEGVVPAIPHTETITSQASAVVTPDTALDTGEFNFNFDQLGFFQPHQSEHLSHPHVLADGLHHQPPSHSSIYIDQWNPHQLSHNSDAFHGVDNAQPPHPPSQQLPSQPDLHHSPREESSVTFRRRSTDLNQTSSNISDKRSRPRSTRYRPRQIALRQTEPKQQNQVLPSAVSREAFSTHWMAQLSEIDTRLRELSSALPQAQGAPPPNGRPMNDGFKANGFPIDEMFKLTRHVADILDQLTATAMDGDAQARRDSADPANSMFVLSTYVRLLDMYHNVFSLVQAEVAEANSDAAFRFWKLPDVTVGSFAVESTPSLQMSLTIQLAEEFLCRLRNATAALDPSSVQKCGEGCNDGANGGQASSSSLFSGVVDISYQAVKSREEGLGKHLAELRAEIESLLDR